MPPMGYSVLADFALATARTDTRRQATHNLQRTTAQSSRHEPRPRPSCLHPLPSRHYRPYAESDAAPHGAAAHSRSDRESDAALRPLVRLPGWPIALALRTALAICAESIAKQTSEAKPSLCRWASHTALRCSTCAGRSLEVSARARCTRQRWYAAPSHPIPFRLGRPMVCAVRWAHSVGCSVVLFCAQARRSQTSKRSTLRAGAARWRAGYPWGYAIASDTIELLALPVAAGSGSRRGQVRSRTRRRMRRCSVTWRRCDRGGWSSCRHCYI